jgi:hypothetical protein
MEKEYNSDKWIFENNVLYTVSNSNEFDVILWQKLSLLESQYSSFESSIKKIIPLEEVLQLYLKKVNVSDLRSIHPHHRGKFLLDLTEYIKRGQNDR